MEQPLYHIDKNGNTNEWMIQVIPHDKCSEIKITHGVVNGKKTESKIMIDSGKNLGKRNETTHFEQAMKEAQSRWNKKKDREGFQLYQDLRQEKNSEKLLPMLAHDFKKYRNRVLFPCFIQPKLDGYRMIFNDGKCFSRQGTHFKILEDTLLFQELKTIPFILDGEVYVHEGSFENLGVLRKKKLDPEDSIKMNQLQYHVYDCVDCSLPFKDRFHRLEKFFSESKSVLTKIRLVNTIIIQNHSELEQRHLENIHHNYEGTIIRNANGKYQCKFRSMDLLKYKNFLDDEFKIIGFDGETDTNGENELSIVWICQTHHGAMFSVRPQGTLMDRKELYKHCNNGHFSDFDGKLLWVKYFEKTERDIPRFPTTKTNSVQTYIRNLKL